MGIGDIVEMPLNAPTNIVPFDDPTQPEPGTVARLQQMPLTEDEAARRMQALRQLGDPAPKLGLPQSGVNAPPTVKGQWLTDSMAWIRDLIKQQHPAVVKPDGSIDEEALQDLVMNATPLAPLTFGGKLGLRNANEIDRLYRAYKLQKAGRSADEIRGETGIFYPPWEEIPGTGRSHPRFEVSDLEAHWTKDTVLDNGTRKTVTSWEGLPWYQFANSPSARLGTVFSHDKLFKYYPELTNVGITKTTLNDGSGGLFTKGEYLPSKNLIRLDGNLSASEARETLIHEIQHWIQYKENFAKGGAPDVMNILKAEPQLRRHFARKYNTLRSMVLKGEEAKYPAVTDELMKVQRAIDSLDALAKVRPQLDKLLAQIATDKAAGLPVAQYEKALKTIAEPSEKVLSYPAYRLMAGEFEARDAALRAGFPDEATLKKVRPLTTVAKQEDIKPESDVWVKLADEAMAGTKMVKASHGTPRQQIFDQFDPSKIGSGEGGAARGWGFYLSDAGYKEGTHDVAKVYAMREAGRPYTTYTIKSTGEVPTDITSLVEAIAPNEKQRVQAVLRDALITAESGYKVSPATLIDRNIQTLTKDITAAEKALQKDKAAHYKVMGPNNPYPLVDTDFYERIENMKSARADHIAARELLNDVDVKKSAAKGGYIYDVTINPGKVKDNWLDWDSVIDKKQLDIIYATAEKEGVYIRGGYGEIDSKGNYTVKGGDFYHMLQNTFGSKQAASQFLDRAGIDGIRFEAGSIMGPKPQVIEKKIKSLTANQAELIARDLREHITKQLTAQGHAPDEIAKYIKPEQEGKAYIDSRGKGFGTKIVELMKQRGFADPEYNYVIFNPNKLKINAIHDTQGNIVKKFNDLAEATSGTAK